MPTMAPVEIELEGEEDDEAGDDAEDEEESVVLLKGIEVTVVVTGLMPAPLLVVVIVEAPVPLFVVVISEAPVALLSGVAIPQSYENSSQNTAQSGSC